MKKVILVLMLAAMIVPCLAGCKDKRPASPAEGMLWDNHGEMEFYDGTEWTALSETKPEIVAGQVWKWKVTGTAEREILEVGEKYVVYKAKRGTQSSVGVEEKEYFLQEYELVEDMKPITVFLDAEDDGLIWITEADPPEPTKPYLHKNPNNDHWICSKHGDLEQDDGTLYFNIFVSVPGDDGYTTYCHKCYWGTQIKILNQHITGAKE